MVRALGENRAGSVLGRLGPPLTQPRFAALDWAEAPVIAATLAREHSQAAAVILAHLPQDTAAAVLALLPPARQPDLLLRIARLGPINGAALADLEQSFEAALAAAVHAPEPPKFAGTDIVAKLLTQSADQKLLLDGLATLDAELAARIAENLFVFADLERLDNRAMQTLVREVEPETLVVALSGVGKSVLLGMMVRNVTADVVVVALIGERGREISDFVASQLDDVARARTIIVAVAADEAPLLRVRGVMRATAIAEYFRSLGRSVVLIVDSLTRVAHAQREIALALGETQGSRGYPASALALLPRLVERAGNDGASGGAITAIYTVLADGDDMNDPVVDTARGVLDGHIVLSRGVAQRGLYPAIDISASVSRVMADIVTPEHGRAAARFRRAHALVEENRDLVLMGAYSHGAEPELDVALALRATMEAYRSQPRDQVCGMDEAVDSLGRTGFADEPDDAVPVAGAA